MYIVRRQEPWRICPAHLFRQSATALGKLGHPDGELNLTRAAGKHGVIQMVRYVPFGGRSVNQHYLSATNFGFLRVR